MNSKPFSDMTNDPNARSNFIQKALTFLQSKGFDGLGNQKILINQTFYFNFEFSFSDIDWEYPGSRDGSRVTDKQVYTIFLKV